MATHTRNTAENSSLNIGFGKTETREQRGLKYYVVGNPISKHHKWTNTSIISIKVKVSLCFNWAPGHEGVLGSGGIVLRILDLGTRWRWVVSFTPQPLYSQRNSSWYPLDRGLGGSQSRSGRGGEERNFQPLPGLEPPIIQPESQRYTTEVWSIISTIKQIKKYEYLFQMIRYFYLKTRLCKFWVISPHCTPHFHCGSG
jgi:hypothetical protein